MSYEISLRQDRTISALRKLALAGQGCHCALISHALHRIERHA